MWRPTAYPHLRSRLTLFAAGWPSTRRVTWRPRKRARQAARGCRARRSPIPAESGPISALGSELCGRSGIPDPAASRCGDTCMCVCVFVGVWVSVWLEGASSFFAYYQVSCRSDQLSAATAAAPSPTVLPTFTRLWSTTQALEMVRDFLMWSAPRSVSPTPL